MLGCYLNNLISVLVYKIYFLKVNKRIKGCSGDNKSYFCSIKRNMSICKEYTVLKRRLSKNIEWKENIELNVPNFKFFLFRERYNLILWSDFSCIMVMSRKVVLTLFCHLW